MKLLAVWAGFCQVFMGEKKTQSNQVNYFCHVFITVVFIRVLLNREDTRARCCAKCRAAVNAAPAGTKSPSAQRASRRRPDQDNHVEMICRSSGVPSSPSISRAASVRVAARPLLPVDRPRPWEGTGNARRAPWSSTALLLGFKSTPSTGTAACSSFAGGGPEGSGLSAAARPAASSCILRSIEKRVLQTSRW